MQNAHTWNAFGAWIGRSALCLRTARDAPLVFGLSAGTLLPIRKGRGAIIRVVTGRLLVTEATIVKEFDLRAGDRYTIQSAGRVLAEAIGPAQIAIDGATRILMETYTC